MFAKNPHHADLCHPSGRRGSKSILHCSTYSAVGLALLFLFSIVGCVMMFSHSPEMSSQSLFSAQDAGQPSDNFLDWVAIQLGFKEPVPPPPSYLQRLASGALQATKNPKVAAEALLLAATAKGAVGLLAKGKKAEEPAPSEGQSDSIWTSVVDTVGAGWATIVGAAGSTWTSIVDVADLTWTSIVKAVSYFWVTVVDVVAFGWAAVSTFPGICFAAIGDVVGASWVAVVDVVSQLAQKLPINQPEILALVIVGSTLLVAGLGFAAYRFATGDSAEKESLLPVTEAPKESSDRLVTAWITRLQAVVMKALEKAHQGLAFAMSMTSGKDVPPSEEMQPATAEAPKVDEPIVADEAAQPVGLMTRLTSALFKRSAGSNATTSTVPAVEEPASVAPAEVPKSEPVATEATAQPTGLLARVSSALFKRSSSSEETSSKVPAVEDVTAVKPSVAVGQPQSSSAAVQAPVTPLQTQPTVVNDTSSVAQQPSAPATVVKRTSLSGITTQSAGYVPSTASPRGQESQQTPVSPLPRTPSPILTLQRQTSGPSSPTNGPSSPTSNPIPRPASFRTAAATTTAATTTSRVAVPSYANPVNGSTYERVVSSPRSSGSPTSSPIPYRTVSGPQSQTSSPLPRTSSRIYAAASSPTEARRSSVRETTASPIRYVRLPDGTLQRETSSPR